MAASEAKNIVMIANGAGNKPTEVEWQSGDTVASVLKRAGIKIQSGQTATLGKRRIRNLEKTKVDSGATIVIAGKVSNG